ncbi:MAG: succinylglutamate desuccinylase/aspartoacylase family protein [Gammaproteobacteria bacterium]|nr:succinylglutamate desuccinylase/aspartoacylase family protein [Gammaproteobacteria bacterium]MDH5651605.1 succinylglutamate desuccinylase/aspartoacylase family protein [Gammaproteobacteria bacterium]
MTSLRTGLVLLLLLFNQVVLAGKANLLDFSLHKLESGTDGPTLLVIGGIQGDEPGGFTAASLLVTDYRITHGNVWVVPNLNFLSIIKRSRGVYGDMNRKFLTLPKADPEYAAVEKIKSIILNEKVDIILNLHDGSGFYNPKYIDRLHNPKRWGQSIIIDQADIETQRFGKLAEIAERVSKIINGNIDNDKIHFYVKNTNTSQGDVEMEKTLTYFAIRNGKSAFGVEASKNFLTHQRALYHLLAVEAMMQELGIKYERELPLTKQALKNRIDSNVKLALFDKKIILDVANARNRLSYIPMKKDGQVHYTASNPLIAVIGDKKSYKVRYGNRSVTQLQPQYFEFDDSLKSVTLWVDGEQKEVEFGDVIDVKQHFKVAAPEEYRVNVIGFSKRGIKDESGILVTRKDIQNRYSVDRQSRKYRVEIYNGKKYCGMVLVNFVSETAGELSTEQSSG